MRLTSAGSWFLFLASTNAFIVPISRHPSFLIVSSPHPLERKHKLFLPPKSCLNYASTTLPDSSDPYVILNLDPGSIDLQEIKKAYRKMALKYHPDARDDADKKIANEEFARVNAAYAFLTGKSDESLNVNGQSPAQKRRNRESHNNDNSDAYRRVRINWGDEDRGHTSNFNNDVWYRHEASSVPSPDNVQGFDIYGNPVDRNKTSKPSSRTSVSSSGVKGISFHDFASCAQVRNYDCNGNPIEDQHFRNEWSQTSSGCGYGRDRSHTKTTTTDHSYFSMPKVPSPDNVQGFDIHGNPVIRKKNGNVENNQNDLKSSGFYDFAAYAQVRDYDANGSPIDKSQTSRNYNGGLHESMRCSHSSGSTSEPKTMPAQNQKYSHIRDFAAYAQVRNYDVNGSPISQTSQNPNASTKVEDLHQTDVNSYDLNGQMTLQNSPSPDNVQRYDIYGNPIIQNSNIPVSEVVVAKIVDSHSEKTEDKNDNPTIINQIHSDATNKSTRSISRDESPESFHGTTATRKENTFQTIAEIKPSQPPVQTVSTDYGERMDAFEKWMLDLDNVEQISTRKNDLKYDTKKTTMSQSGRFQTQDEVMYEIQKEDQYQKQRYSSQKNDPTNPTVRRVSKSSKNPSDAYVSQYEKYVSMHKKKSQSASNVSGNNLNGDGGLPSFLTAVEESSGERDNPRMLSRVYDFFFPQVSYTN